MHIIESLEFGGAEKVTVNLANNLSTEHMVSICLVKREGALVKELNENINVFSLNCPEGNDFSLTSKIRNLLETEKVDILHCHNWGVFIESALAVRKNKSTKLIHTVHGPYTNYSSGFISTIKISVRHWIESLVSKYVCKIVTVSDSIKDYIVSDIHINKKKLQTIHNGISDIGYQYAKKIDEKIKFVAVGRLAEIKNYSLLLYAFSIVKSKYNNIHLTFVGDGPLKDILMLQTKQLDLDSIVTFLGFRTDVTEILKQNDVFLMSSDYEGISIALLESMSLSMPAIATRVGGVPETIINDETGYLVEAKNEIEYAEKIESFLNAPETILNMGMNARSYYLKEFQDNDVLAKYTMLYQQCLDNKQ